MSDIIKLFDGKFSAGRGGSVGQSVADLSDIVPENDALVRLSSGSDEIDLLIDYSDFANFVTFNSAESYVTLTADKILNEYPYAGTLDELTAFRSSLDGYQRYFLDNWPSRIGHLAFVPSSGSYIRIDDIGMIDNVSRSSLLSPGTSSFSVCGWLHTPQLTGTEDVAVVFQKAATNLNGYTVFLTGSQLMFRVISGSTTSTVSASLTSKPVFFSAVCDRSSDLISIFVGTTGTYPTLIDSASFDSGERFDLGSSSFYICSGSIASKNVLKFTGSIDDISVWSVKRDASALSSSYNRKIYAQPNLLGAWRFNEASGTTATPAATIVRDVSGHRLDGRIQNYYSAIRASGSFAFDSPDPILLFDEPATLSYIITAQTSGTVYDRSNDSLVFNFFPESFLDSDDSSVFSTFALTLGRYFDRIKLMIDHLVDLMRVDMGTFNQAPDSLLEEVGRFFGWDTAGAFSDADAVRYFLGRGVLDGPIGNADLPAQLQDIRTAIMRRTLQNLMYIYKTRGTRESVNALLRTHGVDAPFIRLKEYARHAESRLELRHVDSQKSVYALRFVSGSSVTFTTG